MRGRYLYAVFAAVALFAVCAGGAPAADLTIEDFFGIYEGQTQADPEQSLPRRRVRVAIGPVPKGFSLEWSSRYRDADGTQRVNHEFVDFHKTTRAGVYVSAVRTNMFGRKVPLDPMKGEPYMWARIEAATLHVYSMVIRDDGRLELQITERTRTADGLNLRFYRFMDGWLSRAITGTLREVTGR